MFITPDGTERLRAGARHKHLYFIFRRQLYSYKRFLLPFHQSGDAAVRQEMFGSVDVSQAGILIRGNV